MIVKRFSIQSGKPKHSVGLLGELGRKSKKYIPIGAGIGAAYGLIDEDSSVIGSSIKGAGIGLMIAALDTELSYLRRRDIKKTTVSEVIKSMRENSPISPNDYTIDRKPERCKVSVAISGGIMVMYLNKLNNLELDAISTYLDNSCDENRYSDYKSVHTGDDRYVVTVVLPDLRTVTGLLVKIINELGIVLNIVSFPEEKKFNYIEDEADEIARYLLKHNKLMKAVEGTHPGTIDRIIEERSIDPILPKSYGEDIDNGSEE